MEKQVFGISEHLLFLPSVVKCPFFRDTLTERTGTDLLGKLATMK